MSARFLRFVTFFAPTLGVGFWGGVYLYNCSQYVSAPGTGVGFNISTPGGELAASCSNYSFNPFLGVAIADEVRIKDPQGQLLARAGKVIVKGIRFDGSIAPQVQIKNAFIALKRDAKGKFDLQSYLPKPSGEKSEVPYEVDLENCEALLIDESTKSSRRDRIAIPKGKITGQGDDLFALVEAKLPTIVDGQIQVRKTPRGVLVESPNLSVNIGNLRTRLSLGPEKQWLKAIEPLSFESATASGNLKLVVPTQSPISFKSDLRLDVIGGKWDKYALGNAKFKGELTETGLVGKLETSLDTSKAAFEGGITFVKDLRISGRLDAQGITPTLLTKNGIPIPKEINFVSGTASTLVNFDSKGLSLRGTADTTGLVAYKQNLNPQAIRFSFQKDQLEIHLPSVRSGSTVASGLFAMNTRKGEYRFAGDLPSVGAQDFNQWLPAAMRNSTGNFRVTVDGNTKSSPNVKVIGRLNPTWKMGEETLRLPSGDVAFRYVNGKAWIDRYESTESKAKFALTGWVAPGKDCQISIFGSNINLSDYVEGARGSLDTRLSIRGAISKPIVDGKLAAFGLGYTGIEGEIAAATSNVSTEGTTITFKDLLALRGSGQLRANLAYDWKKDQIKGLANATGLTIDDFVESPITGAVDIPEIKVEGKLSQPVITGNFRSTGFVAKGFSGEEGKSRLKYEFSPKDIEGKFSIDSNSILVTDTRTRLLGGEVQNMMVEIDREKNSILLSGAFSKIEIDQVVDSLQWLEKGETDEQLKSRRVNEGFQVRGRTSGKWSVSILKGEFGSLKTAAKVDDVHLNKALLGAGDFDVEFSDKKWTFNALIGSLNDYFRLDQVSYDTVQNTVSGDVLTYNLPVKELISAVEPQFEGKESTYDKLKLISGKLGLYASLGGTVDSPSVKVQDCTVEDLKLAQKALGNLSLKADFAENDLIISDGKLLGPKIKALSLPFIGNIKLTEKNQFPDGSVVFSAKSTDFKTIDARIEAFGFHVANFSPVVPALENVDLDIRSGKLTATGELTRPKLNASFATRTNFKKIATSSDLLGNPLLVNAEISSYPSDQGFEVNLKSNYSFSSLEGSASGKVALGTDWALDLDAPVFLEAKLNGKRDISPFLSQMKGIEVASGGSYVEGGLSMSNTLRDKKFSGGIGLNVSGLRSKESLAMIGRPIDAGLRDISLKLGIKEIDKGFGLDLQASAASAQSTTSTVDPNAGYVQIQVAKPLEKLVQGEQTVQEWMKETNLKGSISMNSVRLEQLFADGGAIESVFETPKPKPLQISGSLMSPELTGEVGVRGVKTQIPALNPQPSAGGTSSFRPILNLDFKLLNAAQIKTSAMEVAIRGSTTIKGPLDALKVDGSFLLDRGELALPGARVKLVPDGEIKLVYRGDSFDAQAEMPADLRGEAAVTTLKNQTTPERYEITIGIKGDLLDPAGVKLSATSIPADLSQDRILGLLGRTDLLESALRPGSNANLEEDLRNAVASFALPNLLGGLTNNVARGLGLEYVSIDYNAFEQLSLSFAKSLGNGFFFQTRRQISAPLPGLPQSYDIRLAFRPRKVPGAIQNLSFSFGTDQFRPYKFSLDYTQRVREQKSKYREVKLGVPK
jgi:hypothetical protein